MNVASWSADNLSRKDWGAFLLIPNPWTAVNAWGHETPFLVKVAAAEDDAGEIERMVVRVRVVIAAEYVMQVDATAMVVAPEEEAPQIDDLLSVHDLGDFEVR